MSSNVHADERTTLRIPSPESPATDISSSVNREKSPKAHSDAKSAGNEYLVYQFRRNSYQQYEQQLDRVSPAHHHHHHHHSAVANMSSMLGSNSVVPPGVLPPLDHYRLQLYNYAMAERLRCSQYSPANGIGNQLQMCAPGYPSAAAAAAAAAAVSAGSGPYAPSRFALSMSFFHNRAFQPEEPKPQHSYIGLIAMAILNSPDSKLVLSDIYQHILDNYPYFRTRGPGWRNSIRHNLSLNDCFIKAGRSANGKGHYWAIHPANLEDFKKGDFRRRKAQRKVRKHMGLAVDDDGTDSSSPPPLAVTPPPTARTPQGLVLGPTAQSAFCAQSWAAAAAAHAQAQAATVAASAVEQRTLASSIYSQSSRKRQFDVASLLAPDEDDSILHRNARCQSLSDSPRHNRYQQRGQYNEGQHSYAKGSNAKRISLGPTEYAESENDEDIDVVASDAENNNNTNNNPENAIDDDNSALLLGYNDDEECMIGDDLQQDEINDESPKSTSIISRHQQDQQHHQKHDHVLSQQGTPVNDDDNVLTDCSNDSSSAARAAAAASWHGIIQHWPGNFQHLNIPQGNTANTRILQRYYGQYMAAAAAQQAAAAAIVAKTRRDINTDLNSSESTQKHHQQIHHHNHHHHQEQQLPSCNENPSGLSRNEC